MSRWHPIGATTHHALTSSLACTGPRVTVVDRLGPDVFAYDRGREVAEKMWAAAVPSPPVSAPRLVTRIPAPHRPVVVEQLSMF